MNILSATNLQFSKKLTDPAYPSIEYSYSLLNNKKEYQIASIMEDPNTIAYNPIITPVSAAATNFTANVQGNYNGLLATVSTGTTTYYLALPSIIAQNVSTISYTELTNQATQSGNLVLNNATNLPATYTNNPTTPITTTTPTTTFNALSNASQTTVGSGIVAYTTTGSLTTTGATALMSNLYTLYNSSNLNNNTTSAPQVATLITG